MFTVSENCQELTAVFWKSRVHEFQDIIFRDFDWIVVVCKNVSSNLEIVHSYDYNFVSIVRISICLCKCYSYFDH
jgi:hypothetical protein